MLNRLTVRNFKSLTDVTIELPRLAILFGPNAVGKSNVLDAIQALAWIGNARTLFDAIGHTLPVRGYSFESFSLPPGGLPALLRTGSARFTLDADLTASGKRHKYRVTPKMNFVSGELSIVDEYLAALDAEGSPQGEPAIQRIDSNFHIARLDGAGSRREPVGLNHSILSDRSLSGSQYPSLDQVRAELMNWRTYYLEPRAGMRAEQPPADMLDIGMHGEYIAPFLYKLRATHIKNFESVSRAMRSIVPGVEALSVDLDERRGTLDLRIRQEGVEYSSRILSEGTLRILALCAITANPWGGSLVAMEEPENGVDPRQVDLVAQLVLSLALGQERQVVVTTHSPLFCDAILRHGASTPEHLGLFVVRRENRSTVVERLDVTGPLFKDREVVDLLNGGTTDGLFQSLLMRGMIQ